MLRSCLVREIKVLRYFTHSEPNAKHSPKAGKKQRRRNF